jgi:hypothetical protein
LTAVQETVQQTQATLREIGASVQDLLAAQDSINDKLDILIETVDRIVRRLS